MKQIILNIHFFTTHNNFFEEIAKFRTTRRSWAKIKAHL